MIASPAAALSALTHNRWALPVLAYVSTHGGCKFITLSRRLGASPASLKRALVRLGELDLVIRNPGYGHPMRPEYVLGAVGERNDGAPVELLRWAQHLELERQLLKKWQLPVLVALSPDATRFGQVAAQLPAASPRALTLALKDQVSTGLLQRRISDSYPPIPRYTASPIALGGRDPAAHLGQILSG